MFVLFIAGEPMTGQRMFQSDEEEGADWQVSALDGLWALQINLHPSSARFFPSSVPGTSISWLRRSSYH
jgi:hypothetical protein